jgi:hypothetical protein
MASGNNPIQFPVGAPVRATYIHSISVQLVVTCGCGKPGEVPLLVTFIPGVPLKSFCPACRKQMQLGRFHFDINDKNGQLVCAIAESMPAIELADPTDMPRDLKS